MVDLHSHILYGIDDGAKDIEESIEMLQNAKEDGTSKIVATPHYCIGYGEEPFKGVQKKVNALNIELKLRGIDIEIYYGQEVYYSTRLLEDLEKGVIGTINDSRYMLIEFDMRELDEEIFDVLYELKIKGIVPIIAHIERYIYIQKDRGLINRFIDEGCLFQLNGGSIRGLHGTKSKETAEYLLERNIYSFIGSDGHNNKNRKTGLSKALDEIEKINKKVLEEFKENGEKVLLDKDVEFKGMEIEKKKRKDCFLFFNNDVWGI